MANLRVLVKRRKAIRNIRKITRTMELIATARFKKALDRAAEAEAYTRKIAELAADLTSNGGGEVVPPALAGPAGRCARACCWSSPRNRGLCGGYNAGIIREANGQVRQMQAAGPPFDLEVAGKRGIAFFKYQGMPRTADYTQFEDKPAFDQVDPIAQRYIDAYVSGQVDRVDVAYMKFLTAARQRPVVETLLPLSSGRSRGRETPAAVVGPRPTTSSSRTRRTFWRRSCRWRSRSAAVQVLPGRGRERADRPAGGHEGGDRERRRPDQAVARCSTTGRGRRTSRRRLAN